MDEIDYQQKMAIVIILFIIASVSCGFLGYLIGKQNHLVSCYETLKAQCPEGQQPVCKAIGSTSNTNLTSNYSIDYILNKTI